jgi:predicted transcriptional regulator
MRTTVELKDEHRAKLLELAARRGEKGFSEVLADAIETYLDTLSSDEAKRHLALALRGAFAEEDADELRRATRSIRDSWR